MIGDVKSMNLTSSRSKSLTIFSYALTCLAILLWSRDNASGQQTDLKFKTISREEGLSNSTVQCIFQDTQGFMWFGTADGLNKYDGYKTIVYKHDPKDQHSISGNYISVIAEDASHHLWVGTSTGLNQFNRDSDYFNRFTHSPGQIGTISSNGINCIYKDKQADVWVGTKNGLNLLSRDGKNFISIVNINEGPLGNNISCIYQGRKGTFWIGTDGGGLFIFDPVTKKFHPFYPKLANGQTITNNFITAITESNTGTLIIGTKGSGLFMYDDDSKSLINYRRNEAAPDGLNSDVIKCLLTDKKGVVWVGTENGGLSRWMPADAKFLHYENNSADPSSLSQKTASAIFEDNTGNLWVGTHRGGVNLYCPEGNKFTTYKQSVGGLSYKDVKTFFEDKQGAVWIGTDGGGLNLWDRKTAVFKHYRHEASKPTSIGSDAILHIMQDKRGQIWLATWGGGLNLYTGNNNFKRYINVPSDTESISSDNIWRIFEDSQGRLWVATFYGGLNLFNQDTKKFKRINADLFGQTRFLGNNVVSINEDKFKNLWFGTDDGGLNCLNAETRRFEHYFYQEKEINGGGSGNIRVIFIDSKQRLWIGEKGLYLFDYSQKKFTSYTNNPLLANENIQGITEDKNGILWVSTRNGLIAFNPQTKTLKSYGNQDGLQGLEFNQNACLRLTSGEMIFGGFNGFNIFNPLNLATKRIAPPIYLTDLQIFNKVVSFNKDRLLLDHAIEQAKVIRLQYSQSVFSLEYAALDYISPGEIRYAYKLEGFDHNWNEVGTQRKATFTNLDPGTYTFYVKARTADGDWGNKTASIRVIISPPYWLTWWFRALCLILLAGIAYQILFYRRRYELKKLEEQKASEIHQVQLQFFTNISHELRTPLSLIAGPIEKLKQENPVPGHAHYYLMMHRNVNRLMALISELMDFRKVEAGVLKLKVASGDFSFFVKGIADDFAEMAVQHEIDYLVGTPAPFPDTWFDRQVVEKIIINVLHNAFKYTVDGGSVSVEVLRTLNGFVPMYENELVVNSEYIPKQEIYIRIADTGRGISKESIPNLFERYYRISQEHLGSGVGLAFVKSLTLLHKGSIKIYSQLDEGTEIIIALPCSKDDYQPEEKWIADQTNTPEIESIRYRSVYKEPAQTASNFVTETLPISKHLLIVDDNHELRSFLKETLGEIYQISEAENGSLGLAKALEETPDLILSDVMMPVMDGIEFCRQIKANIETSHIPFILLTAKGALETQMEGVEGGADHYFSKPVSMELLKLTIRNVFEQRQKIKERYSSDYKVEARELVHSALDKLFMDKLLDLMELQLENSDLNVDYICQQIGMSKTKLYKKIRDITGQTINEFVRSFRLKKSIDIMTHEDVTVTEVMYRIGIQSNSYFTTIFKKEYGKTPSAFMQEIKAR